jgi:hypothetical protein
MTPAAACGGHPKMPNWPPGEVSTAAHEGSHVAAALMGGFRVVSADISPTPDRAGCVLLDFRGPEQEARWDEDLSYRDEVMMREAVVVAAGYSISPSPGASMSSDWARVERIAGRVSPALGEVFWHDLRSRVRDMEASPDFQKLHGELTEWLLRRERLSGDQVDDVALRVLGWATLGRLLRG